LTRMLIIVWTVTIEGEYLWKFKVVELTHHRNPNLKFKSWKSRAFFICFILKLWICNKL